MGQRVPPHCLVDVDVMDKEGDEVAEEEMELKEHVVVHRQVGDLAVLQGNHGLRGQWRAGHARPRAVPAAGTTGEGRGNNSLLVLVYIVQHLLLLSGIK